MNRASEGQKKDTPLASLGESATVVPLGCRVTFARVLYHLHPQSRASTFLRLECFLCNSCTMGMLQGPTIPYKLQSA